MRTNVLTNSPPGVHTDSSSWAQCGGRLCPLRLAFPPLAGAHSSDSLHAHTSWTLATPSGVPRLTATASPGSLLDTHSRPTGWHLHSNKVPGDSYACDSLSSPVLSCMIVFQDTKSMCQSTDILWHFRHLNGPHSLFLVQTLICPLYPFRHFVEPGKFALCT